MNNFSEKGKARLGIAILLISVIVFGFIITPAGIMISSAGSEMADIRSVGGNSVAEAYYQLHGEVYAAMGRIVACISIVICIAGIAWSVLLLKASKDTLKAMGADIKTATNDVKDRTIRAAHELSKERKTATTVQQKPSVVAQASEEHREMVCPNCNNPIQTESLFCTKCGFKIENAASEKTCPSCGKVVANDTAFCTQCGYRFSDQQIGEDGTNE